MTSGDLLELFRVEMADVAEPYLWKDEFIFDAINDAQKQFARNTDGIPDSTTPEVVELYAFAGEDTYAIHPSILKFRSVRRADTGKPVSVENQEDMPTKGMYFDGRPGTVKAIITGMDEAVIRVWPIPMEDVLLKFSVFRLPLVEVVDDQALEIPTQHHRHLLLWVKHLAYSVQDAETFDRTKARQFADDFSTYCFKTKTEQARARHKPRSVAYGGL